MVILEIEYQAAHGWVYPILQAINQTPALNSLHKKWQQHRLSDLAFAIETRLVCFPEIIAYIEENLEILGMELSSLATIDAHISGGFAFRFRNRHALRRILVGVS